MPEPTIPMHQPTIITDGGPWAFHDVACPVCSERKAVLFLNDGTFKPCAECAAKGWELVQFGPVARRWRKWRRRYGTW